jgi:2-dehydro-3-deoxyphosphogluconate aldolase/(4S)-4-hydroxy-2-oxoglutarate aldolase
MSPGFDETTVDWCVTNGMAVAPGIMTPTEASRATKRDLRVLKFFPAEAAGGVGVLRALSSVYPGVGFIPTGGIDDP